MDGLLTCSPPTQIDGLVLEPGDRVLLKEQTVPEENGVYVFGSSPATLTRSSDADEGVELQDAKVWVEDGNINQYRVYQNSQDSPPLDVGASPISWSTDWLQSVRVASAEPIPDLTLDVDEIDGVQLDDGDRILVKDQNDPSQNGIYLFEGTSPVALKASTNVLDQDLTGKSVYVEEGDILSLIHI